MKVVRISLLIFLFIGVVQQSSLLAQPINDGIIFDLVEENISTNFLLNRSSYSIDDDFPFVEEGLVLSIDNTTSTDFIETYLLLETAEVRTVDSIDERLINQELGELVPLDNDVSVTVPIGIIYLDVDYIQEDSIADYTIPAGLFFRAVSREAPLSRGTLVSAATTRSFMCSPNISFTIGGDFLFTNREEDILSIRVDFGDGNGFREVETTTSIINISYEVFGEKSISVELKTTTGTTIINSKFEVYPNLAAGARTFVTTGTVPFITNIGYYDIYLSCDQVLDKPIIVVEGFSINGPSDSKRLASKYFSAGIFDRLTEEGYDFITVGFASTYRSAHDNALLLETTIESINERKERNFDNVIIGESMGGILARISLANMEARGVDHECRTYISFDSPHGGSNLPLGIQELVYDIKNIRANVLGLDIIGGVIGWTFFGPIVGLAGAITTEILVSNYVENLVEEEAASTLGVKSLDIALRANNSTFSRQSTLRINRYEDSLVQVLFHQSHLDFYDDLTSIGYPVFSRNVSFVNGSITNQEYTSLIDGYIVPRDTSRNVESYVITSPVNEIDFLVSKIHRIKNRALIDFDKEGKFDFPPQPFDIAPGSFSDKKTKWSFVNTASAIDIDRDIFFQPGGLYYFDDNSTNPLQKRTGLVRNGLTPFDDIYGQSKNTQHISFDEMNTVINRLIERELMFDKFDLQNRVFTTGKIRDFHANELLSIGRSVNQWPHPETGKLITEEDVIAEAGSVVNFTSEGAIIFSPGTSFEEGSSISADIVVDNSACSQTTQNDRNRYGVEILPFPAIVTKTRDKGEVVFSLSNAISKAGNDDYEWEFFGMSQHLSAVGKTAKISNLPSGQYTVVCKFADGLRNKSSVFSVSNTKKTITQSVQLKSPSPPSLKAYPNPTTGKINWSTPSSAFLYAITGQLVAQTEKAIFLDVSHLPSGTYYLLLNESGKHSNQQRHTIIIQ